MASAKPSTCAIIGYNLEVLTLFDCNSTDELLPLISPYNLGVVAIDSPLGFPKGLCCLEQSCPCTQIGKGRLAEQELSKMGISSYYTTKKTIIKPMIYKAISWARELRSLGLEVIEIYPYASKVQLFGKPVPNKSSTIGLNQLKNLVSNLGFKKEVIEPLNHDQIDAVIAAYTGLLWVKERTIEVGCKEESTIVLPEGQNDLF